MARKRTLGKKRKSLKSRNKKRGKTYRKMRRMRGGGNLESEFNAGLKNNAITEYDKYKNPFINIKETITIDEFERLKNLAFNGYETQVRGLTPENYNQYFMRLFNVGTNMPQSIKRYTP